MCETTFRIDLLDRLGKGNGSFVASEEQGRGSSFDGKKTFHVVRFFYQAQRLLSMRLDVPLDDLFQNRSHVRILRALHRLPKGFNASGRELARRSGISHPTALKALVLLINIGVVAVERGVAGDLYRLNHAHLLASDVKRLFDTETGIGDDLVSFLRKRLRAFGPKVKVATLFGSAAWGVSTPESDIDLAISCSRGDLEDVENALWELSEAVQLRYGIQLSPLIDSGTGKRRSAVWKRIEREGIPLIRSGKPVT